MRETLWREGRQAAAERGALPDCLAAGRQGTLRRQ